MSVGKYVRESAHKGTYHRMSIELLTRYVAKLQAISIFVNSTRFIKWQFLSKGLFTGG